MKDIWQKKTGLYLNKYMKIWERKHDVKEKVSKE
jgi:hypothetical protein